MLQLSACGPHAMANQMSISPLSAMTLDESTQSGADYTVVGQTEAQRVLQIPSQGYGCQLKRSVTLRRRKIELEGGPLDVMETQPEKAAMKKNVGTQDLN